MVAYKHDPLTPWSPRVLVQALLVITHVEATWQDPHSPAARQWRHVAACPAAIDWYLLQAGPTSAGLLLEADGGTERWADTHVYMLLGTVCGQCQKHAQLQIFCSVCKYLHDFKKQRNIHLTWMTITELQISVTDTNKTQQTMKWTNQSWNWH